MKPILLIIIFISLIESIQATTQSRDILIINRDTFRIGSPLERDNSIFTKKWHETVSKKNYPRNTACYRGAIFVWRLINDSLYLEKILRIDNWKEIKLKEYIPNAKVPVFAYWINGLFDYHSGKKICCDTFLDYMGSVAIFEFDNDIVIQNGIVKKHSKYDNRKTNLGKFQDENELFEELDDKILAWVHSDTPIEFELLFNTDSTGHISNITIFEELDCLITNDIMNAINDIDGLPVLYDRGKCCQYRFERRYEIFK